MEKRFIEIQDKNGTHHIGTSVEYITMPDGTFLSDNLGNLNVMQKGSVGARLNGLENNRYAPITNPQFSESLSVITQNNNTAFKVAEVNDEWQTKIDGQLLINGTTTFRNKSYNKGITVTPPTSSTTKNILVADNGIQIKVGSNSILNINSNNLEVLKDIALVANNLTTTGTITASNLPEMKVVTTRGELFTFMDNIGDSSKIFFLQIPGNMAYKLVRGVSGSSGNEGWGICKVSNNGTVLRYLFIWASQIYFVRITRGASDTQNDWSLYTILGSTASHIDYQKTNIV